MTAPAFEGWGVLELLGHRIRYGQVSQVMAFGEAFCRIDMPTDPPTFELYAGKSIYGWRPAPEATIRAYHAPRRALTVGRPADDYDGADDEDDDSDDVGGIEIATCGACGKPLGDEFVSVDVDEGGRELWHRDCAEEHAAPVQPDPAAPEAIEGGA